MNKIKSSISRNLILSFVLLVTIIFSILAWFSSNQDANATGLSVKSTGGLGLLASFTGEENSYSTELTEDGEGKYEFTLVSSGDGENFIIPALDLTNGKAEEGTQKRVPVAGVDYFEKDIYFRADEELDVYLDDSSKIKPSFEIAKEKDPNNYDDNLSNFGNFSRDYIAGAARAAIFNITKEDDPDTKDKNEETLDSKLLWIPNETYQLSSSDGFEELQKETTGSGFGWKIPESWTLDYDNKLYFYELYPGGTNTSKERQAVEMYKDKNNDGIYYAIVDKVLIDKNVDHMVNVSAQAPKETNGLIDIPEETFFEKLNNKSIKQYRFDKTNNLWVTVGLDLEYSADDVTWPKLYYGVSNDQKDKFTPYDKFNIIFKFDNSTSNRKLEIVDFIYYQENTVPLNYGGGESGFGSISTGYKFDEKTQSIVITGTNNNGTYALGYDSLAEDFISTKITLNKDNKINIDAVLNNIFNVKKQSDTTAYLEHIITGKYLGFVDGKLSLVEDANKQLITLETGSNGPALKFTNGKYLSFTSENSFTVSDTVCELKIFKGTSYSFSTNGSQETYWYYSPTDKIVSKLVNYTISSGLKNKKILTLTKDDNSQYYTGHIKVRIWVEGEDREAKIPLVNGRFKNLLCFRGVKTEESTTESTS